MIEVNFNPKKLELKVDGHSHYAEEGKDIVCSAVSMLFYTLVASLEETEMQEIESDISKGASFVRCNPKADHRDAIELIYWTILNGYQLLAVQYSDYVKLTIEKGEDE